MLKAEDFEALACYPDLREPEDEELWHGFAKNAICPASRRRIYITGPSPAGTRSSNPRRRLAKSQEAACLYSGLESESIIRLPDICQGQFSIR